MTVKKTYIKPQLKNLGLLREFIEGYGSGIEL